MHKLIIYGEQLTGRLSNALRNSTYNVTTEHDVTDELIDAVARMQLPALGKKSRDEFFRVLVKAGRVEPDYLFKKYNRMRWPITQPSGWLRGVLYQETDATFEGACELLERSKTEKISRLGERGKAELERLITEVHQARSTVAPTDPSSP